ncbi:MAG: phage tail protein [Lysobacter sp.]
MEGPNVVWFGDLEVVTLKKKVKTGWFSSKKVTTGFNYYLGVQLVYAYGECDEFIELRADDKVLNVSNKTFSGGVCSFVIDSPTIMDNGDPPEGVKGSCKLYKGTFVQPANLYLQQQWGETETSAFRPLVHLVMEHCYLGNSETPPPISLIARRCPNPLALTGGRHNINGDANIANACYEVMTNMLFGMKINGSKIDTQSFIDCGNVLADEGLGISMLIQTAMSGRDLMAEMLRHADGVIYPDPVTGLYTMKLARKDYELEDLLVFDDSNIDDDSFEFSRASWENTKNNIIVKYTDRETFDVKPVQYQDLANIDIRNGYIDSEEIDFLGFSNAGAALRAAARACKTRSSPLLRVQFTTNRKGYQLRPGSVFLLTKQTRNLVGLVMRVIDISYGTLDDPAIKVTACEDIFAVNAIAYEPPPDSGWVPVLGDPAPINRQGAFELPYEFAGSDGVYVGTLASATTGADIGYDIYSGNVTGDANLSRKDSSTDFTASGVLVATYSSGTAARDPTGFQITSARHMNEVVSVSEDELLQGDSIALIISGAGRELVAFKAKTDLGSGIYQIADVIRGVYGTVALTHTAGALVWFLSTGFAVENQNPRAAGSTVFLKYLTKNPRGTLPLAAATQLSLALTGVAAKPYAARYLRINGVVNPASFVGDAALTWEFVNPAVRGGRISVAGSGSDPVTPGVTFTVRVYINNVLVRTVTGLTVPSYNYTVAMRLADSTNTTHQVKFGVTVIRDALAATETQTTNATMTSAATAVSITTASPLPGATVGSGYNAPLAATGGAGAPYTWSVSAGALPAGITIDNANQRLTGSTSATPGVFNVTLRADSPAGVFGTKAFTLTVT